MSARGPLTWFGGCPVTVRELFAYVRAADLRGPVRAVDAYRIIRAAVLRALRDGRAPLLPDSGPTVWATAVSEEGDDPPRCETCETGSRGGRTA